MHSPDWRPSVSRHLDRCAEPHPVTPARRVTTTCVAMVFAAASLTLGAHAATAEGLGGRLGGRVVNPVAAARAQAQTRWQRVVDVFQQAGGTTDAFYGAADAASALWMDTQAHGWHSPEVPELLAALAATANPDGGYGLSKTWDAYQDGTVNPASTSYNATTAGHVGAVLLAGYLEGAVPASLVNRAIDSILDMPRSFDGTCIPYSNSPNDLTKSCVWNVSFGAAAFVAAASQATGYRGEDAAALARSVLTWLTPLQQNPDTGYWPYSSAGGGPQDIGHQLWTATAIDYLTGTSATVKLMLSKSLWRSQAATFHDSNVAASMSGIALLDCRYATDRTILRYAGSTDRGKPYAFKAMSAQAKRVVQRCFPGSAGTSSVQTLSRRAWPVIGAISNLG
jgi:hypothetical protein